VPVRSDAATATTRWVNGMSNSGDAMKRGVSALTVSPGQSAAQAADKWLAKVTQSKDKFARRVGAVSLSQWQNAMNSYGINRVAQGAQAKQGKMQSFMGEFLPYLKTGVDQINAMPKTTLEDGINRAVAMIRHNAGFQRGTGMGG
jgi:hypothetical protein